MPLNVDTLEQTYALMAARLGHLVPDFELRLKAELVLKIERLKRARGALILGHNYMEPALFHTVADLTGDSLELCRQAAATQCDPIVFCGVRFMAETAKVLNPDRTVLIPSERAGCSLAASITGADVRALKARFPGVPVVSYINTSAEVKAESDIICTSSNAARVVDSLGPGPVMFLPDEYLARNVARETGRHIIFPVKGAAAAGTANLDYQMIGWEGRCEVHEKFTVEDIERVRAQFPDALVLAHPECSPAVVEASDFSGSTSAMIRFVRERRPRRYLLLTECSMADNVAAETPGLEPVRMCSVRCPHMNEITLEQTLMALELNRFEVTLPAAVMDRARAALERMLAIGPAPDLVPSRKTIS